MNQRDLIPRINVLYEFIDRDKIMPHAVPKLQS